MCEDDLCYTRRSNMEAINEGRALGNEEVSSSTAKNRLEQGGNDNGIKAAVGVVEDDVER